MLTFLWINRIRPSFGSSKFFRVWAKRVLTLPTLMRFTANRRRLIRQGALIAADACVGKITVQGRLSRLQVGQSSFIGEVKMMLHDTIEVGSNVCINDGVLILTATHDVRDSGWRQVGKPVRIGDFAWIATGATILPGVCIGRGAVVGACAVVTKDVPDYAVAIGNPVSIRENVRANELRYSPVQWLAFQEAWLGK